MDGTTACGNPAATEDGCTSTSDEFPRTAACVKGSQTNEVEELKKELLNLKLQNLYLSQRVNMSTISANTEELIAENAKLKARLIEKDTILEKARAYIIDNAKNTNPFCTSEEQKLQERVTRLTKELDAAQITISGYETERKENELRIEKLDEECAELRDKLGMFQHEAQTLRQHRASASAEAQISFLEAETAKLTVANKQFQQQLLSVEEELNEKRRENDFLTDSLNELQETLNTFATCYQQKSQQLKELKKGHAKEQDDSHSASTLTSENDKGTIIKLCQQLHDEREQLAKAVEAIAFYKSKYLQLKEKYDATAGFSRRVLRKLGAEKEDGSSVQKGSEYRTGMRKLDHVLKLAEQTRGQPDDSAPCTDFASSLKQLLELATSVYAANRATLENL